MGYAGVAQYLLDDLGILALFEYEGGEGVPKIVGAGSLGQASRTHEGLEVALNQVVPTDQVTSPRREDEVFISSEPRVL